MPDDLSYWDWRDALLMHPAGRAKGGEPCVKCSEPVPPNAHWKHRDRHVCGPRCNSNLGRQINRLIKNTGELDLHGRELGAPTKMSNPRTSGPRIFRTTDGLEPPVEWEGFGVRQGDLVERYGVVVGYALLSRANEEVWPNWWPAHVLVAMELHSRHQFICGATADWDLTRLGLGSGVVPADVGADRGVLLGVAAVVGAAQGEVAQRGELGFDPVQPGRVGGHEHQLDLVVGAPGADVGVAVWGGSCRR